MNGTGKSNAESPNAKPKPAGAMSIAEAVAPHDVVGRVLRLIEAIPAGQVRGDESIRREIGISDERWRRVRGSTRLSGYAYQMPDRVLVWGRKPTITQLSNKMQEIL